MRWSASRDNWVWCERQGHTFLVSGRQWWAFGQPSIQYTVLEISHHNSGTGPGPQNFSTSTNVLLRLPPHFWPEAIWIETSFTSTNVKLRLRFVVHLTYHWHSPEPHLTTWPSSDLPLTLTRPLSNIDLEILNFTWNSLKLHLTLTWSSPGVHLTFTWPSDHHLTSPWPLPNLN